MFYRGRGRSKYGAIRTNGLSSKLEAAVYDILLLRQKQGEIKDIKLQQTVVLQEGSRDERIAWKVDFSFERKSDGATCYAEAKGIETSEYRLKLKMWRKQKIAPLEIWKGDYRRPKMVERIE